MIKWKNGKFHVSLLISFLHILVFSIRKERLLRPRIQPWKGAFGPYTHNGHITRWVHAKYVAWIIFEEVSVTSANNKNITDLFSNGKILKKISHYFYEKNKEYNFKIFFLKGRFVILDDLINITIFGWSSLK